MATPTISPRKFEGIARKVMGLYFSTTFVSKHIGNFPKKFDLVGPGERIAGDATYLSIADRENILPSQFINIAGFVWMLEKLDLDLGFIVFGNDKRVPLEWLDRYGRHLNDNILFFFIDGDLNLYRLDDTGKTVLLIPAKDTLPALAEKKRKGAKAPAGEAPPTGEKELIEITPEDLLEEDGTPPASPEASGQPAAKVEIAKIKGTERDMQTDIDKFESLVIKARSARLAGHFSEAKSLYAQSINISRKWGMEQETEAASSLLQEMEKEEEKTDRKKAQILLDRAKSAKNAGRYADATNYVNQAIEIYRRWKLKDEEAAAHAMLSEVDADQKDVSRNAQKLEQAEEQFQNDLADKKYTTCLETIPQLISLAQSSHQPEKASHYTLLQGQIQQAIKEQEVQENKYQEKVIQIEKLKKYVFDLANELRFFDARKQCERLLKLAQEIDDQMTMEFCTQKVKQLEQWEKEISQSDLMKWDIYPFRPINRLRFEFSEVFSEKSAAQTKLANIITSGQYTPDTAKMVTIVREKFKGKGPYNPGGECYAIYFRKTI